MEQVLVGTFAGVAALMAALGLYGVLAHAVTQQRREIGIRMALGARPGDVVSHTLRSALSMLLVGLAVGLAGALALTRALKRPQSRRTALREWIPRGSSAVASARHGSLPDGIARAVELFI